VRSAVLEVEGRNHIVAVADLGPDGAFLKTRLALEPSQSLRLRIVLPRDGREVTLPCELVWRSERGGAASGRPPGIGVRFKGMPPSILRRTLEFVEQRVLPPPEPPPGERYEYRVLERPALDGPELNRLGREGWTLASALRAGKNIRLVLMRRL
jgi:hypothetical protein